MTTTIRLCLKRITKQNVFPRCGSTGRGAIPASLAAETLGYALVAWRRGQESPPGGPVVGRFLLGGGGGGRRRR